MGNVPRAWTGETVAILATGPSLTVTDVATVRGRVRTIAVNDAVTIAPWADVLYSSDRRWWNRYGGVPSFTGAKYAIGQSRGRADGVPFADVVVLRHTGVEGLEHDPSGLRSGEHSGYAAINLATHFGAARILLLGYDLGAPAVGSSHFFGRHPTGLRETTAPEYARFRGYYRALAVELAILGVAVVNCTPGSRLDLFPSAPVGMVLDGEAVPCQ